MDWREIRRRLFPRGMIEPDIHDEIRFHIEGRVRELVQRGRDEAEARREVLERFGDVTGVAERCRRYDADRVDGQTRRWTMEGWLRDVRLTLRGMARNPGFTAVVVVTLAVGIGATTSVFSVVEGFLLRPLPYHEADRLVMVWENDRASGTVRENASPADYYDFVERARTLESLAMYWLNSAVIVPAGSEPVQLRTALATRNLPDVLGTPLQLGRTFSAEEDGAGGPRAVILSDRLWRERFGADRDVLGTAVSIDGLPHTVVGVTAPGVEPPGSPTDVWLPIAVSREEATRWNHYVRVVARMAPGATVTAAQADMSRIMSELQAEYPDANTNRGAFVERVVDVGRADLRLTLWVLFGAVLTVLAIACVNVANLLLARGATRSREVALHTALGAGAGELRRRFLVEGLLVGALASAGGLGLAMLGVRLLSALAPARLLVLGDPRVDGVVLAFTVGIGLLVGVGFALLPAVQARRVDLQSELKDGRATGGRTPRLTARRALVAVQLSLAVVLLVAASLLLGTLRNLQAVDPGFRSENVVRMDVTLPESRYPRDFARWPNWVELHGFNRALVDELEALPGVRSAAIVVNHPLDPGFTNSFVIEGVPYDPDQGEITTRMVTPGYFETVGLERVEGRLPHPSDGPSDAHVIVLNRRAVERYFPEGGALGTRIRFWDQYREVVGIVENERMHGLAEEVPAALYVNLLQSPPVAAKVTILIATDVAPLEVVDAARRTVWALDPGLAVYNVATLEETVADASARERFGSIVLGIFAGVALFLSILGVHGVLAYLVACRGHEVGVRMALGATRSDVVRIVVRQGAGMAVLGISVGLLAALALSRVLRGLLFGVSATEPWVYAGVAATLGVVALAATALPAWRAASVAPVSALRGE
jgi:predicted permease